jgi:hypothetical protein
MRVPHYAMRPLAAAALIGLMTGCGGGDSNAPDAPFDPAGTNSDIGAIEASFESEAMYGFESAMPAISDILDETAAAMAVRAAPRKGMATGKSGVREYAGGLAGLSGRPAVGMRPVSPRAAILEEHLGVTFTRNPETLAYEPSDRTGAPSNGVRFIVYAVNPINGQPVTPLNEVGYADVEVSETAAAASVRVELVSGDVTYLDYTVGVTVNQSQTAGTITISGFVTNGEDRMNFDLDLHVTENAGTLEYTISVPTRGNFRIDYELEATSSTETVRLELRGPHGTVTIVGSPTDEIYEVEVNGEAFATIDGSQGGEPVISGADGEPLTEEELQVLREVYLVFVGGFFFFVGLPGSAV